MRAEGLVKLTTRLRCAVTLEQDLEPLYSFPRFPVFMGCVDQPEAADLREDMNWYISRGSGLIQLKDLIPLEVLYQNSHGAGAVGALWERHHRALARFLRHVAPAAVLEIGGAHGILAREFRRESRIPWTILEPNPVDTESSDVRFIPRFFDDTFELGSDIDTVVYSHVFEHIFDPDWFVRRLSQCVESGKHVVFSIPNLGRMLELKFTNFLNFEHTILLTEPYVELLLGRHGFRVVEREYFLSDHSIFYAAVRDPSAQGCALPEGLFERNRNLFEEYVHYHIGLVKELNQKLAESTAPAFLFGAHVFSQYLIAFGLDTRRIDCLLDNDPKKWTKRLYGTGLRVDSPRCLSGLKDPVVVLRAGVFNREIRDDILTNINDRTIFLE